MNCQMRSRAFQERNRTINDYLDIFQFWFRDVLMFKATQEVDNLVFKQEINLSENRRNSVPMRIWRKSWIPFRRQRYV